MKKFFLYTLLLLFAFVAALPSLLSSNWVREKLLASIKFPGTLAIESISLSWFSGQELRGVVLKDPEGKVTLKAPLLTAEVTLWSFLETRSVERSFTFTSDTLTLERPTGALLKISDSTVHLTIHSLTREKISLACDAKGSLSGKGAAGSFQLTGEGTLTPTLTFTAAIEGKKLPFLEMLDFLSIDAEERKKAEALVGEFVSFEATAKSTTTEGVFSTFHSKGDQSEASIKGTFEKGVFTLEEDASVDVTVNPLLSREILNYFNPLLISAVRGDKPISFKVMAKDTRLPLLPLNAAETEVSLAVLDPGKIILKDEGLASTIFQLLGGKNSGSKKEIAAWFTPQRMHIQKGIVQIERMDILLANQFHLALWGKVDLTQEKAELYLGISLETLKKVFGIKNPTQMLTILISGNLDNPKVDTTYLLKEVAALLAKDQIGDLGSLLQTKGASIPEPTMQPFPWEAEFPSQKEESSSSSSSTPPLNLKETGKQLEKGLKDLFRKKN